MRFAKLILSFLSSGVFIMSFPSYAGVERCPPEAIHCIYPQSAETNRWVRVQMLPRGLIMIVCLSSRDVIYLENDDVKADGNQVGDVLTWVVDQCQEKECREVKPIGVDRFVLKGSDAHMTASPSSFAIRLDSAYGEACESFGKPIYINREPKRSI